MSDESIQKLLQNRPKLEKLCADLNVSKAVLSAPKTTAKKSSSK